LRPDAVVPWWLICISHFVRRLCGAVLRVVRALVTAGSRWRLTRSGGPGQGAGAGGDGCEGRGRPGASEGRHVGPS
jgi:hypothetical protein